MDLLFLKTSPVKQYHMKTILAAYLMRCIKVFLCYLCSETNETVEHFILRCKVLEPIRQSVISEIDSLCIEPYNRSFYDHPVTLQLQFILDAIKCM